MDEAVLPCVSRKSATALVIMSRRDGVPGAWLLFFLAAEDGDIWRRREGDGEAKGVERPWPSVLFWGLGLVAGEDMSG